MGVDEINLYLISSSIVLIRALIIKLEHLKETDSFSVGFAIVSL
jgi:hypothetical protein